MAIETYHDLACEANAHTVPNASSHHVHIPKGYGARNVSALLAIVEREALDQLEVGQNVGIISPHY